MEGVCCHLSNSSIRHKLQDGSGTQTCTSSAKLKAHGSKRHPEWNGQEAFCVVMGALRKQPDGSAGELLPLTVNQEPANLPNGPYELLFGGGARRKVWRGDSRTSELFGLRYRQRLSLFSPGLLILYTPLTGPLVYTRVMLREIRRSRRTAVN